jgi:L-aspartate oxidase
VGVLRSADGLAEAAERLDKLGTTQSEVVDLESWETTNLLTVSTALADAAALREETRGSHWRDDFPARDDERFAGHFDATMADGATTIGFEPAPPSDGVSE